MCPSYILILHWNIEVYFFTSTPSFHQKRAHNRILYSELLSSFPPPSLSLSSAFTYFEFYAFLFYSACCFRLRLFLFFPVIFPSPYTQTQSHTVSDVSVFLLFLSLLSCEFYAFQHLQYVTGSVGCVCVVECSSYIVSVKN